MIFLFLHSFGLSQEDFQKYREDQIYFSIYYNSLGSELDNFKESLKCCKGLIVLSKDSKDKLSKLVDVPVYNLKHPIPYGIQTFNMDDYNFFCCHY